MYAIRSYYGLFHPRIERHDDARTGEIQFGLGPLGPDAVQRCTQLGQTNGLRTDAAGLTSMVRRLTERTSSYNFV